MAQLPDAHGPGYESLRRRVETALDLNSESPSVEFKAGTSWNALKKKIIRTVLAMSNLQDGGIIIIGRPEATDVLEGVNEVDLATFDPDEMHDQFDAFASPRAIVTIAKLTYRNSTYVVIDVNDFEDVPIICKKNEPDGYLRSGAVYIRPFSGRPRSIAVSVADEMRSVIELAIDKGIVNFEARAARRGYQRPPEDQSGYDAESGGF